MSQTQNGQNGKLVNGKIFITESEAEDILAAARQNGGVVHVGAIFNTDHWTFRTKTRAHFAQIQYPIELKESA